MVTRASAMIMFSLAVLPTAGAAGPCGQNEAWEDVAQRCIPFSIPAAPAPTKGLPDIEKEIHDLVCKELEDNDVQEKVTIAVCKKVHDQFGVPESLCMVDVRKAWDTVAAKCAEAKLTGLPEPIKKEIHDLVCKELENSDDEEKVTTAVCAKVHDEFSIIPEFLCKMALKAKWDSGAKDCATEKLAALPEPIKKEIHDLVCKELEDSDVEEKVTTAVCTKVHEKLGISVSLCTAEEKKAWDTVAAKCAEEKLTGLPEPINKEIHDLVCKELEDSDVEEKVTTAVCTKAHEKLGIPESLCMAEVKKAWDTVAAKCAEEKLSSLPEPIKKGIHDLVCKELEKSDDEEKVTTAVCAKVHDEFSIIPESLCKMALKAKWDSWAKDCATEKMAALPEPIKKEIHDLVCKELEDSDVEEKVTTAVCTKVHEKLGVPESLCSVEVKKAWDTVAAKCAEEKLTGLPEPIKKEIHDLVCKELEDSDVEENVTAAVCTKVHEKLGIPESFCTAEVKKAWDTVAAKCAEEKLAGLPEPIKKGIHDFVCKELEKSDDEEKVTTAVCAKVHDEFSIIPEFLCKMALKAKWDSWAKDCATENFAALPEPLKNEIHDLVCKELEDSDVEEKVTTAVCTKLHEKLGISVSLCTAEVKEAWDTVAAKCAEEKLTGLPEPIKQKIHDFVCKELEKSDDEERVTTAVCAKVHDEFSIIPEFLCKMALKAKWDSWAKECATEKLSSLPEPIKDEIHDVVCDELKKGGEEEKVATGLCAKLKGRFTWLPERVCEDAVKKVWDMSADMCSEQPPNVYV